MSGPIVPPLTVSDVADGGSVTGRPITALEVTSGTLTVSGRTATLVTGGGGGGSGTVTSITAAADSGTGTAITTSGTFTYTGGTGVTTAVSGTTVTITADNNGTVTSITPAADSGSGTAITSSGTLTFTGGTRVTTSVSGTTVTIDNDAIEGTAVLSTGETGGTKFLREDGDGTCSWQAATATVPDPLQLSAGSAAAPTYSFSGDTDTGLYSDGSNSISMAGGGTRQMTFGTGTLRLGTGAAQGRISTYDQHLLLDTDMGTDSGSITVQHGVNQDILIEPDGTGIISFYTGANAWTIENGQGDADQVLTTDGAGAATWEDAGGGGSGGIASVLPLIGSTGADQYNVGTAMPWGNSSTGTQTMIGFGGQPHAFPFIAPETGTVNEIGLRVTTGEAGMSAYVAIYSNDANNLPSTLLGYATVALDSTGNIFDNSLSANPSLVSGTAYWYTVHGDAAMYNAVIQANTLTYLPDLGISTDMSKQTYSIKDGATTQYAVPPATLTPNTLNIDIKRPYVALKYA